jgi:hypothetical protein
VDEHDCKILQSNLQYFALSDQLTQPAASFANELHSRNHHYLQLFKTSVTSSVSERHRVARKLQLPIAVKAVTVDINQDII